MEESEMRNKGLILTLLFAVVAISLNAQSHNEEVTIEGSYVPQIKKSERILLKPQMPEQNFTIPEYQVNTEDFFYNYKVELEPVAPLYYTHKKQQKITNNFLKAGIGTRLSPDFLFKHYSDLSKKCSLGIGVLHNSTWTDMKNYDNTKYMNNAFSLSMTNRFSGFQLHTYVDYHYDMYYLYANQDDNVSVPEMLPLNDNKRNIHALNLKLLANNNQINYKSLYNEFLLDYTFSGIQHGVNENLIKFKTHTEYSSSWFRNKESVQTLSVDINADMSKIEQTLVLVSVNPYLDFDGNYYNLHLGFKVDAKTNSTNMGGIYPDVKGSLYLFERNIEFYAGLGGGTKINTLKDILTENPFIISDLTNYGEFDYQKNKIEFQAGLKFNVMNKLAANAGIRYRNVGNYVFYVPSLQQFNAFDISLSDCNVFNFNLDIHYRMRERLNVIADFAYNRYDILDNAYSDGSDVVTAKAWYKPEYELTLKGVYEINKFWNVNAAAYFEAVRYALVNLEVEKLKPICDIQLGCDYKFNDDLAFYAEIKNLIHNKYQIYYDYPSYGIQLFVGFKYKFL